MLAGLILTVSTASAAVTDLGNALGPSGGYTGQASYQATLGGQPMTADQQAYADQQDQLRQLGFRAEMGGDFGLGQMFYHVPMAWRRARRVWRSVRCSTRPVCPGAGLWRIWERLRRWLVWLKRPDGSAGFTIDLPPSGFLSGANSVPEPSTWTMMLLGFGIIGYAGWRGSRKAALHAA